MAKKAEKVIITVLGKDKTGIVATVSTALARLGANIEDMSSTKMQDMFVMLVLADISKAKKNFAGFRADLELVGKKAGLQVMVQHEDIFTYMHRL